MRADAAQNRQALLQAARALFVERGLDVPLDAIAQRAGVSIATLYRRFPDRATLVRAVAVDAMDTLVEAVEDARRSAGSDAAAAWRDFAGRVGQLRFGVLIPLLLPAVEDIFGDAEVRVAHDRVIGAVTRVIGEAQAVGAIRGDVTPPEVMLLLVAVTRPLPGPAGTLSPHLADRFVEVVLAGLAADHRPLPGEPLAVGDALRALRRGHGS